MNTASLSSGSEHIEQDFREGSALPVAAPRMLADVLWDAANVWLLDRNSVNTLTDEAPRARMPITLAEDDGLLTQDTSGLFTSRAFWIGGAISILLWTGLVLVLHYR